LKREGRCFKCQEIGRMSSNCLGDQEVIRRLRVPRGGQAG
jgi:hypothetical protein